MTERAAFEAKSPDGRPQWQILYDHLVERIRSGDFDLDDIITHDEICELVDTSNPTQVALRASQELQQNHRRALLSVRGIGYKLVAGNMHLGMSKTLQLRSARSLQKAARTAGSVDLDLLSPDERTRALATHRGMNVLAQMAGATASKLAEHEELIGSLMDAKTESSARHEATADEIAELHRRLDEIEGRES